MQQAALILPRFEAPSPGRAGVISGVRCQGSSKLQVDFVRSLAAPLKFSEINLVTAAEVITTWHVKPLAPSSKTSQEEMPFSDPSSRSCHSGLGKPKKMTLDFGLCLLLFFCISLVNDNPPHLLPSRQASSMANRPPKETQGKA